MNASQKIFGQKSKDGSYQSPMLKSPVLFTRNFLMKNWRRWVFGGSSRCMILSRILVAIRCFSVSFASALVAGWPRALLALTSGGFVFSGSHSSFHKLVLRSSPQKLSPKIKSFGPRVVFHTRLLILC